MKIEQARVLSHKDLRGHYRLLALRSPKIASRSKPGQFVHMRIPNIENSVLRRPFSIYRADRTSFSILYKQIGRGTASMRQLSKGDELNLIGPLGNGFPIPPPSAKTQPVLVAGGYGVAPLAFFAQKLKRKGILFVGGASSDDVLCVKDFRKLGWTVKIATEDGSLGVKGLVTNILDPWLAKRKLPPELVFYACGPDGLLKAVGRRAIKHGRRAWLSLGKHMGCGVGACLTCVQKIRTADGKEVWARVCKDGPVFEARQIVW